MDIVMAGVRKTIPVKVTPQMRAAVAAFLAPPARHARFGAWPEGRTDAKRMSLTAVDCPLRHCRAEPGARCLTPQGHEMREKIHSVRHRRATAVFDALVRAAQK